MDRPHLAAGRIGIPLLALPATEGRRVHRGDGRRRAHAASTRRRPGRRRARPVAAGLEDAHHVVGSHGDTLYLRTERAAPRGRLVAIDLATPDARWQELIGQHEADVLVGASPAA